MSIMAPLVASQPSSPRLTVYDETAGTRMDFSALTLDNWAAKIANMLDEELRAHLVTLDEINGRASGVLEYWLMRRDEGVKEKEALEGVIENLVGFVKGRRGG